MEGLPEDQENQAGESAEVERMVAFVMKAIEGDVHRMAEAIVLNRDDELLSRREFELRDKALQAACRILEATIDARKKGGGKAAAQTVRTAGKTPASYQVQVLAAVNARARRHSFAMHAYVVSLSTVPAKKSLFLSPTQ